MSDRILTFHIEEILAISCKSLSFQDGILQCLANSPARPFWRPSDTPLLK